MDYVEIDVNTSRDGVMYLFHGPGVERTTNGQGKLHELTAAEIDGLDAGSWFDPKFAGERIPRLEPFLRWIKGQAKVYFDVKHADLPTLLDLVYDAGLEDDCFFWFGRPEAAHQFRQLDQVLALKINVKTPGGVIQAVEDYQANIIEVDLENVSQSLLETCRTHSVKVMIYHQKNDPAAFQQMIAWDPDLVNVNHGDVFAKILAAETQ
jgi:glycerophosphoryl diester phosphodiesterase